jgi:VWFA-related protein
VALFVAKVPGGILGRRWVLTVAVLLAGEAGSARQISTAQQAVAPPDRPSSVTFRSEANFVEVHAIVTDQSGAFVRGLTAADFEILEDGRPITPTTFSFVDLPIERPLPVAGADVGVEPDVRATSRTFDGRLYVLLLDDLHTNITRTQFVREAARRFVDRYLSTNDLAAVVYTSGRQESGQELTNSRRLLRAAIDRFQGQKLPSAGAERLAVHLRQAEDAVVQAGESQPIRTQEGLEKARAVADPTEQQRAYNARRALQAIENVADWLRDVQGRRKALLFFSEGIDYDVYEPFAPGQSQSASTIVADTREAMAAAQRANVNIYGVDPRGLSNFGELITIDARSDYPQLEWGTFRGALHELRLSQESLISLANETGGIPIVNAGDVLGGLGRIVLDNSRYYLLGYNSDTSRWAKKFLPLEVKVSRPGVTVRARRGFLPPDTRAVARAREADVKSGTSPALKAALSRPVPIGDLPMRVTAASFRGAGSNGSVVIALEIDGGALKFEERDGRFNERLEVSIVAADEKAKVQGGDRQEFNLRLQRETYERVREGGVRLLSRLELPPGRYQIHVGAHEAIGAAIGTVPFDVEVPDYGKVRLALSDLLVTSSRADALVTPNPDPALKDALPAPPVATRVFGTADTIGVYAEAYAAARSGPIALATTVVDARDGRRVFEATERRVPEAGDRGHGFTSLVPLAGLAPGSYVLRVQASTAGGVPAASREIPFDVR